MGPEGRLCPAVAAGERVSGSLVVGGRGVRPVSRTPRVVG